MTQTEIGNDELIEQLASMDESHVDWLIRRASILRQGAERTKELEEAEEKLKKLPKKTIDRLSKRIKKLTEPVPIEIEMQLGIKFLGTAIWDMQDEKTHWALEDHEIRWKVPKQLEDTDGLARVGRSLQMQLEDALYEFDIILTDQGKALTPQVEKRDKEIKQALEDLRKLEEKSGLPEDSIWNYLVDEEKI